MRFHKATGLTPSEKLLAELCDRSFLSLWAYPNLFRQPGKELCDLLVVFGDDVVVFSDKSCTYPAGTDPGINWNRWYRRSIDASARQVRGAEDWLRQHPNRVFLDAKCVEPIPISLPSAERMRVHRVCVAIGAAEQSQAETGKRTLTVSAIVADGSERFTIGRVRSAHGMFHVFDDHTLPIVLSELSTTADFLDYLRKKETLFESDRFAFAESELDLLGYFLWNNREFPALGAEKFKLNPNLWQQVESDAAFLAARKENEISFFWDGLIERLTELWMKEQLAYGNEIPVTDHERLLRTFAAETRFSRRLLTKWIFERAKAAKGCYVGSYFPSLQDGVLYVLLIGPGEPGAGHEEYRKARSSQLYARCIAANAAQPDRRFLVGLGLDAMGVKGTSEDFVWMDTKDWSEERLRGAERLRDELGYFIKGKAHETRMTEAEYPGT